MILITAIGRSGTAYIARILRSIGLDVHHESFGRDGTASWYWAAFRRSDTSAISRRCRPPILNRTPRFRAILHQVRDPLNAIASFSTANESSWEWIYANTPVHPSDPLLKRCSEAWLHWNRMAEEISDWTYRIESLGSVWPEFCARVGVSAPPGSVPNIPHTINSRPHRTLSWEDIRTLTPTSGEIEAMAKRYGYQTE